MFQFPLKAHMILAGGSCYRDFDSSFFTNYTHPDSSVGREKGNKKASYHQETAKPDYGYSRVLIYLQPCIVVAFQSFQREGIWLEGRGIEFRRSSHGERKHFLDYFMVLKYPEADPFVYESFPIKFNVYETIQYASVTNMNVNLLLPKNIT